MHYYKKLIDEDNVIGLRASTRPQPATAMLVEITVDEYTELEQQLCPEGPQ